MTNLTAIRRKKYRYFKIIFILLVGSYSFFLQCKKESLQQPLSYFEIDSQLTSFFEAGFDSLTLKQANELLQESKKEKYQKGVGDCYNLIGALEDYQGRRNRALIYFDSCLHIRKIQKDSIGIAKILCNIGYTYSNLAENEKGMKLLLKGITILERYSDNLKFDMNLKRSLADAYLNYANCWANIGIVEKAMQYQKMSGEKYLETKDSTSYYISIVNLANSYYRIDSLEDAMILFKKSMKYFEKKIYLEGVGNALNGLAIIEMDKENYEESEQYLKKSILHYEKMGNDKGVFLANLNLSYILIDTRRPKELSVHLRQKMAPVFKTEGRFDDKQSCAEVFEEYFLEQEEMDSAYYYRNLAFEYRDSFLQEASSKEMRLLAEDFDLKMGALKLDRQKLINRKNIWIRNSLILVVTLLILGFLLFRERQRVKLKLSEAEVENQKKKLDDTIKTTNLKVLNTYIESQQATRNAISKKLHDKIGGLFVIVNSGIKEFLESKKFEKEDEEQLQSLSQLMDRIYRDLRDISHALDEESRFTLPELIQKFIEAFSKINRIKFEFLKNGDFSEINPKTNNSIFEIVLELIANALKHADANKISIQLSKYEEEIHIIVEDDGVGFDEEKVSSGIGLNNIKDRIEYLNGKYYIDSSLGTGTTVMLEIPTNHNS